MDVSESLLDVWRRFDRTLKASVKQYISLKQIASRRMEPLRPYLTVGTAYVATDWLLDFGLVTIPQPFAFALFTTRFGAVVLYSLFKLMHAYRVHSMNDGENT